jgi:hypothetical protein
MTMRDEKADEYLALRYGLSGLYGYWVLQYHEASVKASAARTKKEQARWRTTALTYAQCARGLRTVAQLDVQEPHEISPRQPSESEMDYHARIGFRS